jgi:hypothetical protein
VALPGSLGLSRHLNQPGPGNRGIRPATRGSNPFDAHPTPPWRHAWNAPRHRLPEGSPHLDRPTAMNTTRAPPHGQPANAENSLTNHPHPVTPPPLRQNPGVCANWDTVHHPMRHSGSTLSQSFRGDRCPNNQECAKGTGFLGLFPIPH